MPDLGPDQRSLIYDAMRRVGTSDPAYGGYRLDDVAGRVIVYLVARIPSTVSPEGYRRAAYPAAVEFAEALLSSAQVAELTRTVSAATEEFDRANLVIAGCGLEDFGGRFVIFYRGDLAAAGHLQRDVAAIGGDAVVFEEGEVVELLSLRSGNP